MVSRPHSSHVQTVLSESACLIKAHELDLATHVHSGGGYKQQEEDDSSKIQVKQMCTV